MHHSYLRQEKQEALWQRRWTSGAENPLSFRITKARHEQACGFSLRELLPLPIPSGPLRRVAITA
jgi:hypothetical protein